MITNKAFGINIVQNTSKIKELFKSGLRYVSYFKRFIVLDLQNLSPVPHQEAYSAPRIPAAITYELAARVVLRYCS